MVVISAALPLEVGHPASRCRV